MTRTLERIVATKREEVRHRRRRLPPERLADLVADAPPGRDFAAAVAAGPGPRIIAEVKRASPSKGVLVPAQSPLDWDPAGLARAYEAGGARALSVLTDTPFFWGSDDTLAACRGATGLPVLRKDFVLEPYQIDEARWLGADAVLLITAVLDDDALHRCAARALELDLAVLVESHREADLERALSVSPQDPRVLIGINHRDLTTLAMDPGRVLRLRDRVPPQRCLVAESGLASRGDLEPLLRAGVGTFLIGGSLAAAADPAAALGELVAG